jgi:hypothetical protein
VTNKQPSTDKEKELLGIHWEDETSSNSRLGCQVREGGREEVSRCGGEGMYILVSSPVEHARLVALVASLKRVGEGGVVVWV